MTDRGRVWGGMREAPGAVGRSFLTPAQGSPSADCAVEPGLANSPGCHSHGSLGCTQLRQAGSLPPGTQQSLGRGQDRGPSVTLEPALPLMPQDRG